MRQVISIDVTGGVYSLDHKQKGIDLRNFGDVEIERVTLVEWDYESQKWYLSWKKDGAKWSAGLVYSQADKELRQWLTSNAETHTSGYYLFDNYEDAIKVEVSIIQSMQVKGSMAYYG